MALKNRLTSDDFKIRMPALGRKSIRGRGKMY